MMKRTKKDERIESNPLLQREYLERLCNQPKPTASILEMYSALDKDTPIDDLIELCNKDPEGYYEAEIYYDIAQLEQGKQPKYIISENNYNGIAYDVHQLRVYELHKEELISSICKAAIWVCYIFAVGAMFNKSWGGNSEAAFRFFKVMFIGGLSTIIGTVLLSFMVKRTATKESWKVINEE